MSFGNKVVAIKSAWSSKINWTQVVALGASGLALWGIEMDTQTQVAVVTGIQGIQAVATWVMRTWFTTTVTPASVT